MKIVVGGQIDKQKVYDTIKGVVGDRASVAIALLGMNQCATVSMPGKMLSEDEILAQVKAGKKAYGFTDQHIEKVVPIILKGLGF